MALLAPLLRRSLLEPGAQALAERLAAAGWQCAGRLLLDEPGTCENAGTTVANPCKRDPLRVHAPLPTSAQDTPPRWRSPFASPTRHFHTAPGTLSSGIRGSSAFERALAAEGVADWAAYGTPAFHAWASRADPAQLAAKAAELSREGLAAADVERLFQQSRSPLTSDLEAVFCPNLAYLRPLLAGVPNVPKRREPAGLTVLGRLLRDQPSDMARVLNRDPAKVQVLERWVCGRLRVSQGEFVQVIPKSPSILCLSVENARAVAGFLRGELGLSQQQVVRMLLAEPLVFKVQPDTLRAKLHRLRAAVQLGDDSTVLPLVLKFPRILAASLSELPNVLVQLDSLFARDNAGAELVAREPILATSTPARVARSLAGLRGLLGTEGAVQEVVASRPALLVKDVAGPDQRQKLEWNDAVLRLPFPKLLGGDIFQRDLRRMASRLAFLRHLGLPDPTSLNLLGRAPMREFVDTVSKRAGRAVSASEFEAFVAAWLGTPEGRRWGF